LNTNNAWITKQTSSFGPVLHTHFPP
jgi:hypothetical protein